MCEFGVFFIMYVCVYIYIYIYIYINKDTHLQQHKLEIFTCKYLYSCNLYDIKIYLIYNIKYCS